MKLWEAVAQTLDPRDDSRRNPNAMTVSPSLPAVSVQKMTPANDPEAYLNAFEWMAIAAGWERKTWAAVLSPCLIGPAQQAVDMVPITDLNAYDKVSPPF